MKIKSMKNDQLIEEWKMIDAKIKNQQNYGKFELNYRSELEAEMQKRNIKN